MDEKQEKAMIWGGGFLAFLVIAMLFNSCNENPNKGLTPEQRREAERIGGPYGILKEYGPPMSHDERMKQSKAVADEWDRATKKR